MEVPFVCLFGATIPRADLIIIMFPFIMAFNTFEVMSIMFIIKAMIFVVVNTKVTNIKVINIITTVTAHITVVIHIVTFTLKLSFFQYQFLL